MALASLLGLELDLARAPHDIAPEPELVSTLLFSESATRFLVEVTPAMQDAFERFLREREVQHFAALGTVTGSGHLVIRYGEQVQVDLPVSALQVAWKGENQ